MTSLRSRRISRIAAVAAISLVGMIGAAQNAFAVTSPANYYGPVNGHRYVNWAGLDEYSTYLRYSALVGERDGNILPVNWMGAQVTLYKNGGAICASAAMTYNSSPNINWTRAANFNATSNCPKGGNYYSRGSTASYNGAPYATYYTSATVLVTW